MTDPNWHPEDSDLSAEDELAIKTAAGGLWVMAALIGTVFAVVAALVWPL